MKNKKSIVIVSFIVLLIVGLVIFMNKKTYTIEVFKVDDQSPDRTLVVYDNKKNKVDVKKIELLDGTLLCYGYNMTVYFGDIENVTELKIIFKDNKETIAKIVKDEVKE